MRSAGLDLNYFCKFLRCLHSFIVIYLQGTTETIYQASPGFGRNCLLIKYKMLRFLLFNLSYESQLIRIPNEFGLYVELYSS